MFPSKGKIVEAGVLKNVSEKMTFPKPQVAWTFQTLNGQSCMPITPQTNRFWQCKQVPLRKVDLGMGVMHSPGHSCVKGLRCVCERETNVEKNSFMPPVVGFQPAFLPLESLTQCSISRRVKILTSLRLARPETPPLCAPGPALALTSLLPFHLPHVDPALAGSGFVPIASLFSLALAYSVPVRARSGRSCIGLSQTGTSAEAWGEPAAQLREDHTLLPLL